MLAPILGMQWKGLTPAFIKPVYINVLSKFPKIHSKCEEMWWLSGSVHQSIKNAYLTYILSVRDYLEGKLMVVVGSGVQHPIGEQMPDQPIKLIMPSGHTCVLVC